MMSDGCRGGDYLLLKLPIIIVQAKQNCNMNDIGSTEFVIIEG
jgi:hypothetical protein